MDNVLKKRREIFFNNLILLGLDKISLEKKHGISFHKDMFVLPNKKGYEIVTYFLFSKLSSATGKDYNIPWPLLCKEHDRTFQKTCYSHLMNFSQENCVKFPRIVASLLSTFGGDRFYNVYLAFSSYVLNKAIKKNGNIRLLSVPSVSRESSNTAKEILQLSTILNTKKFREAEIISYQSYKIWLKFAKILEEFLRKLKCLLKSYKELIKEKRIIALSLFPTTNERSFIPSLIIKECFDCLEPVLKQRKILDTFLSSEQRYWQHLSSEVGESAENIFINGQDYRIHVSDYLPEEYVKELKKVGCMSSNENGKLCVERFIQIFMAYLTFIVDLLKKTNLNDLKKACFVENASAIEDDLNCIKNLNKKLSDEIIPHVKKNIKKLKVTNGYDDIDENLELLDDQFCSLPIPSFDIEAVKQRASHFDGSLEKIFYSSSEKQLCSKKNDDNVFPSESNSAEHSFASSTNQNLVSSSFFSSTSNVFSGRVIVASSNELDERNLNDHSSMNNVPSAASFSSSKIHISSLNDLDFSCPTRFKMRESWLEEESLNTMTLPDISFDE